MPSELRQDWDVAELRKIAKASGVRQTVADVNYAAFLRYHAPEKIVVYWFYCGAFILLVRNKKSLRIIGIACVKEWQRKGVGSYFLRLAIQLAKREGYSTIETRSKSGADFYCKKGFDVTGMKGGDYLLKLDL